MKTEGMFQKKIERNRLNKEKNDDLKDTGVSEQKSRLIRGQVKSYKQQGFGVAGDSKLVGTIGRQRVQYGRVLMSHMNTTVGNIEQNLNESCYLIKQKAISEEIDSFSDEIDKQAKFEVVHSELFQDQELSKLLADRKGCKNKGCSELIGDISSSLRQIGWNEVELLQRSNMALRKEIEQVRDQLKRKNFELQTSHIEVQQLKANLIESRRKNQKYQIKQKKWKIFLDEMKARNQKLQESGLQLGRRNQQLAKNMLSFHRQTQLLKSIIKANNLPLNKIDNQSLEEKKEGEKLCQGNLQDILKELKMINLVVEEKDIEIKRLLSCIGEKETFLKQIDQIHRKQMEDLKFKYEEQLKNVKLRVTKELTNFKEKRSEQISGLINSMDLYFQKAI